MTERKKISGKALIYNYINFKIEILFETAYV